MGRNQMGRSALSTWASHYRDPPPFFDSIGHAIAPGGDNVHFDAAA